MTEKMKFGLTKRKSKDFQAWYQQLVTLSDLIDIYNIRGCIILKPNSMFIWSQIQNYINKHIQKRGVNEVYFPMLITKDQLEKEKSHIVDFQPEVAWVTKSGNSDIEPLAIRPTSETVMYPYFSKWIRSHRDLPLKVNQWCNILRWEVKSTVPFIRGREFLWQEGHCAYLTKEECDEEVYDILNLYRDVYKELLAVPTIKGRKSEAEKFGGADYTLTVEAFIKESGRGIQAATSHSLGNNFAKMFDIKADDFVYQSSWGLTTRSIGVAVMTHSDDKGLVLSPNVAMTQIIIIPCGKENNEVNEYIKIIQNKLNKFRIKVDDRDNVSCGYKFNYHELRGVPLRIEVGLRDLNNNSLVIVPRHTLIKKELKNDEDLIINIENALKDMHNELYEKARKELEDRIKEVKNWKDFKLYLNQNNILQASWCNTAICENKIKIESEIYDENGEVSTMGAKSLCIPFDRQMNIEKKCFKCENEANCIALFGRCY
ncbi:hypothetical protein COBT_000595 [Conglomerata obtusa]